MPTSKQYWHDFPMRKLDITNILVNSYIFILKCDSMLLFSRTVDLLFEPPPPTLKKKKP